MTKETNKTEVKYCFSYIRFSSKKQELGSSLDRQEPIAERVAKAKGWLYRPEFNARSLGVSGYNGDNKKVLLEICELAKQGTIPQGTVMILEALDRATRLTLDEAQQLIRSILLSGIEIYTDMNQRHLTKASLNKVADVMITAVELDAAFQYSDHLSERSTKGFAKLFKQAKSGEKVYFGGVMPSYISGVKDGEWKIDKVKQGIVKRIFNEYLSGKALNAICIGLNSDINAGKLPRVGMKSKHLVKWAARGITVILRNQAYKGDFSFKGTTLKGYLPKLVSKTDFDTVQLTLKENTFRRGGSPKGEVNSIFKGVAKCHVCGDSMVAFTSKTKKKTYTYYICGAQRTGGCKVKGNYWLNLHEYEADFMMRFLADNPFDLYDGGTKKTNDTTPDIQLAIASKEKAIADAVELVGSGLAVSAIKDKLTKLEAEKAKLETQLQEAAQIQLQTSEVPKAIQSIQATIGEHETVMDDVELGMAYTRLKRALQDRATRQTLHRLIPRVIKTVRFDGPKGAYCAVTHDGKTSEFHTITKAKHPRNSASRKKQKRKNKADKESPAF